jgi:hypothetical protein
VPGVWLHSGANEIVALDLFAHEGPPKLRGIFAPAWQ